MSSTRDVTGMLTGLLEAGHLAELERLPFLVGEYAARAGLWEVAIYLADLQQTVLRPLTGRDGAGGEPGELRIDATL
ncbi:hypothetical protein ACFQ08_27850, partial [Streptosporangium algeriense]